MTGTKGFSMGRGQKLRFKEEGEKFAAKKRPPKKGGLKKSIINS